MFLLNFLFTDSAIDIISREISDEIKAVKLIVPTLMPEVTLVDSLPRSTVKIPLVEPNVTRTVGVITPKERALLSTEKLFYDFLQEFFTRLDDFKS